MTRSGTCKPCSTGWWTRSLDRLQARFDRRATVLKERRQGEMLAEALYRFVGGEARTIGGDLEQDAVRLAEIETLEIEAIDLAAARDPQRAQAFDPLGVDGVGRRAEGDVMGAAAAGTGTRLIGFNHDMEFGGGTTLAHPIGMHARAIAILCAVFADRSHVHDRRQDSIGRLEVGHAERNRAETADPVS